MVRTQKEAQSNELRSIAATLPFGSECRTELDTFIGANEEPSAGGNLVSLDQRGQQDTYELARRQTTHAADATKHLYDRNVDTAIGRQRMVASSIIEIEDRWE